MPALRRALEDASQARRPACELLRGTDGWRERVARARRQLRRLEVLAVSARPLRRHRHAPSVYQHRRRELAYARIGIRPSWEDAFVAGGGHRRFAECRPLIERATRIRNQVVEQNLGLVHWVARRFSPRELTYEELVQEGSIGLLHAVDQFDVARGVKFGTYAVWLILERIARFLALDRTIAIRPHLAHRAARSADGGELPGEPPADIRAAQGRRFPFGLPTTVPLEALLRKTGGEPEVLEGLQDTETPLHAMLRDEAERMLSQALRALPRRDRIVVSRRGVDTLENIGRDLGISKERVRQIEAAALKRIRRLLRGRGRLAA